MDEYIFGVTRPSGVPVRFERVYTEAEYDELTAHGTPACVWSFSRENAQDPEAFPELLAEILGSMGVQVGELNPLGPTVDLSRDIWARIPVACWADGQPIDPSEYLEWHRDIRKLDVADVYECDCWHCYYKKISTHEPEGYLLRTGNSFPFRE